MRRALLLLAWVTASSLAAKSQVPAGAWVHVLTSARYSYLSAPRARLTPAQAASLNRFVRAQYHQDEDAFNSGDIGTDCATVRCLTIKSIRAGRSTLFIVQPYPPETPERNPCWWLIQFDGARVKNLTPKRKDFPLPNGYLSVERWVHHGVHDVAALRTSGAGHIDITYFEYDGRRYRTIGYEAFSHCNEFRGRDPGDERWCSAEGRPVTVSR